MTKLPASRTGTPVTSYGALVEFSFYPTYKSSRRHGLHSRIYTSDPWSLILSTIKRTQPSISKDASLSFFAQSKAFFIAASQADNLAARPLLYYYSYLNLAKSYFAHISLPESLGNFTHGLSDYVHNHGSRLVDAVLIQQTNQTKHSAYALFSQHVCNYLPPTNEQYTIPDLLASTLIGHRLWCEASNSNEHYLRVSKIVFMREGEQAANKEFWIRIGIQKNVITRLGLKRDEITQNALGGTWRNVATTDPEWNGLAVWESPTHAYTGRPADRLHDLVEPYQKLFFRTNTTQDPFRLYYLRSYQTASRIQIMQSRYLLMYYLGSVVRYHPHDFEDYLNGDYGAFLTQHLTSEPNQFISEMTSLFCRREVATLGLV